MLSVVRLQPTVSVSGFCTALHVPLAHKGSVRVRVRLPVVEQLAAKVHAVYALYVVVPHEMPSVTRTQACASPAVTGAQVPVPEHCGSERVRVWPPALAQALPPSQALHALNVVVPQPTPASAKPLARQVATVPLQRSSTSQVVAAARQMRLGPSSPQVPLTAAPCATLHASQVSAQAELQHRPSTQKLDWHSVLAAQVTPLGLFAEQ